MGEVGIVPEIQCRNCGRRTNTACADWILEIKIKKPTNAIGHLKMENGLRVVDLARLP